jgi:predicted RNA binding protein YcfA (HicA-like mRNA interferase family)
MRLYCICGFTESAAYSLAVPSNSGSNADDLAPGTLNSILKRSRIDHY